MILVTGGAGFIGSNIVAALNASGRGPVVVSDLLRQGGKWQNLRKRQIADIIPPEELAAWLPGKSLEAVIHMGANSATTASDGDEVMRRNFRFSLMLLDWCTQRGVPFIYASSAATYGDGGQGYDDVAATASLARLRPLNLYGWSKHLFDQAVAGRREAGQALPPLCCGLKFFNVYGPNEQHKGAMRSVVHKVFETLSRGDTVELFRSHRPDYADGEQLRDFTYVDDAVEAFLLAATHPQAVGHVFNLGGVGRVSLRHLAQTLVDVAGRGSYTVRAFPADRKKIDIGDYYSDCRLIGKKLGWKPRTTIKQALAQTFGYYRRELQHYL